MSVWKKTEIEVQLNGIIVMGERKGVHGTEATLEVSQENNLSLKDVPINKEPFL